MVGTNVEDLMIAPLVALLVGASAQADGPEIPFEKYELENGLDVILAADHSTPIVYVSVWYHVGSKDEEEGLTGFAHLFEHLMFQGTPGWPGEYFEPLHEVGADVNGTTSTDRTNYLQSFPAEHLPLVLWLESDRMGWLPDALTQEKLDEQRGVVKNERRQRIQNPPYGEMYKDLLEQLYPENHPYHHMPIGSHADLDAATLADVKAFFRTWYLPNNASLVIAGDFDSATARELVDRFFGEIPRGTDPVRTTAEPVVFTEDKELRRQKVVPEARAYLSWHTPKSLAPGEADLSVVADILADGKDSRLHRRLVKELGVAKAVSAWNSGSLLQGRFTVRVTASDGHTIDECIEAVEAEVADLLIEQPPTDDEVALIKTTIEVLFFGALQGISGKGEILQSYNMETGDPGYIGTDLARYQTVTAESAAAAAREWLSKPHAVVIYEPEPPTAEGSPQ